MTALSDLLNARKPRDWSAREVARRAQAKGHDLAEPTATAYFGGRHAKRPSLVTLQALSDVLPVGSGVMRIGRGIVVVAVAAGLVGCGSPAVSEGDRVACESYVRAHAAFRGVVDEVAAASEAGQGVPTELRDRFAVARDGAYASVGDAAAVAQDPDLVVALRRADAMKHGLLNSGVDAATAYAAAQQGVKARCVEIMSPKRLRPLK